MRPPLLRGVLVAALLVICLPAASQPSGAEDGVVRVRVLSGSAPSEVSVSSLGVPLAIRVDGREAGWIRSTARLRATGSEVEVSGSEGTVRGRRVQIVGSPIQVRSGRVQREYIGDLYTSVEGRGLQIVNHVPMTDYVASVVASEYPFTEIEGVKAQAVLARTYALRRRGAFADYDLDDHQGSQVYKGRTIVTARAQRAAEETHGEVLLYGGDLADAPYSSSSGGHTADNESLWSGSPLPYLRGVPDPYDAGAPDHSWQTSVDRDALHRTLSRQYGGRVTDVRVEHQSREGRVVRVRLVGGARESITGSQFRSAANLAGGTRTVRSTRFTISTRGDRYVFDGSGFGHGVGMSQYGARGQAQAGRSYRDILSYYFQGTAVGVTTVAGPAPLMASSRPAFQANEDDPIVRGSTQARRWPTPRRLARPVSDQENGAEPTSGERPRPQRRRAW